MSLNALPPRVDGWLIRGEGCELSLTAAQPWDSAPVLRVLPDVLTVTATTDADIAVWSLTAAQVEAISVAAPAASQTIAHHVTVGIGESLRTVAAGMLTCVRQGTGDPAAAGFTPSRVVVGPPGIGADPDTIAQLVADWLAANPSAALADHIADPTPHAAYDDDLPSLSLIFDNHLL